MPLLPQAATTGASIFEKPPNTMEQAKPEIGQSQQIQNFLTFAHLVVGSALTIIFSKSPRMVRTKRRRFGWRETERGRMQGRRM